MGFVVRAALLLAAGSVCVFAVTVARATDVREYNFNNGSADWKSPVGEWLYTEQGGNEKSWKLMRSGTHPAASRLYSPCFTITDRTVRFDIQEHRFAFATSGTGTPLAFTPPAGQVQYSLDDGLNWHGVPLACWSPYVSPGGGGDTPPTLNPAAFPAGTSALEPDGYAFQGVSRGSGDRSPKFIRSAFELSGLIPGDEIEFRFLGDLGSLPFATASPLPIWDVSHVQIKGVVEGPCMPEPGGLALAGSAVVAAVSSAAWRGRSRWTRRRSRRPCSARAQNPAPATSG